jgi:hypothetical protein
MKNYLVQERILSKYGNKETEYRGVKYHSKKEAEYAMLLDTLFKASNIKDRVVNYERQVPFKIYLNEKYICKYLADFVVKYADGREEVIDVKGVLTQTYKLKKKLVQAQYNIEIIEV